MRECVCQSKSASAASFLIAVRSRVRFQRQSALAASASPFRHIVHIDARAQTDIEQRVDAAIARKEQATQEETVSKRVGRKEGPVTDRHQTVKLATIGVCSGSNSV